jgi:two-component system, sensor histidine kinase and response regulator
MFTYYSESPKVLLADNNILNILRIKDILAPIDLDLYIANTGEEVLMRVSQTNFDMIILESFMPDSDVYELCREIKNNELENDTTILFISESQTNEEKEKWFECGGDDYLIKPFYEKEVLTRVKIHLKKHSVIKHLKSLLKHSFHELYNPLTIIKTSAEMYGYRYPKNTYVDTMHAAAKSLHLIYEDLYYALETKKTAPHQNDVIDLSGFLRKRLEYFTLLAEVKKIRIELDAKEMYFIEIISSDLQRIIDNTISNAIKYSFENSIINISVSKKSKIILKVTNRGNTIINPNSIFSDGYREAYNTIGMGIGLEIVSSICQRLNIIANVESSEGTTVFTYTFIEKNQ